jgi:DNA-directed RNA polymerase specialized sigma24 family protein
MHTWREKIIAHHAGPLIKSLLGKMNVGPDDYWDFYNKCLLHVFNNYSKWSYKHHVRMTTWLWTCIVRKLSRLKTRPRRRRFVRHEVTAREWQTLYNQEHAPLLPFGNCTSAEILRTFLEVMHRNEASLYPKERRVIKYLLTHGPADIGELSSRMGYSYDSGLSMTLARMRRRMPLRPWIAQEMAQDLGGVFIRAVQKIGKNSEKYLNRQK